MCWISEKTIINCELQSFLIGILVLYQLKWKFELPENFFNWPTPNLVHQELVQLYIKI